MSENASSFYRSLYFLIKPTLQEDLVWKNDVAQHLAGLPENVLNIWNYSFTEIFNNAIDHSDGTVIWVTINRTAERTRISIGDDGEGIFRKIQRVFQLADARHAILELAKGKLTTDPDNHTGEGIFFSSRMLDRFVILSRGLVFLHDQDIEDWLTRAQNQYGTSVIMELANGSRRTTLEVFSQFSSDDGEFSFDKTVVPVALAAEDGKQLVSRSQAKRLIARIDRFKRVVLDFSGVTVLGQGFADQVFRIFTRDHPDIELGVVNASPEVEQMIRHARNGTP